MTLNVIKRDGSKEILDVSKIHRVVEWACEGLSGVSVSTIELKSQIQFYNGIKSDTIHEMMIKASADLITEDNPNYQYVAGRLVNYALRKSVYGKYEPDHLLAHYNKIREVGYYDDELQHSYTIEEWNDLNSYIDHDRDMDIVYVGMEQLRGKYLVKNRVTGEIYETPQMAYMLVAMCLFSSYEKDRLNWVKDLYDALSNFDISLPTPIMAGVRTPQRQFSSCVLIDMDDSLDSINATASSIVKYVSQKAGIGINGGKIRALKSPVRGGDTSHTGVIPFYRYLQSATKSCSQGSVRNGSATIYFPIWHLDVEDLLVLKNNKGTEETRLRDMDYGVQFNKVMYERLVSPGGVITLFSPHDVPELYDTFFTDVDKFRTLYEKAERNTKIRKKSIPAKELFSLFMAERFDTHRIYLMNVDHCNSHSPFNSTHPILSSNLCAEVALNSKALKDINDPEGRIALCTLGAINWGRIKKPKDFKKPSEVIIRALDALLDYQKYPVLAAELHSMEWRPLGVGIINLANFLAKNSSNYSNPNLQLIHEYSEAWSYYLMKASANLAAEKGSFKLFSESKYGTDSWLPIDTYKKELDELGEFEYKMDWEGLREQISKTGIRNVTQTACMPSETSAVLSNSTNGIEPPRALVSIKSSKDGVLKQVVPDIAKLKNKYELAWDQPSPRGYLMINAIIQKFNTQAMSTNTTYNPKFYEGGKVPMDVLLEDILLWYRWGGKTLYYLNAPDDAGEVEDRPELERVETETDCDSCSI